MYKALNYDSMGETLLINTLSNAYYAMTKKAEREGHRIKEGKECIAFIQNSGIHQIIAMFQLDINPNTLQNLFYYYVHIA